MVETTENPYDIARKFEGNRAGIVNAIIKAEVLMDMRRIVILTRRFLDAWPQGTLSPIERAIKATFEIKLKDAKYHLKGTCPVCGDHMHEILCPDDIMRPWCPACQRTYTPMGYDCDDDYALKWWASSWVVGETGYYVEVK